MDNKDKFLFEVSWEVCNKVGGIYTVVKSKAALINEAYPNYFLIGPYVKKKADIDLEETQPPEEFRKVFDVLEKEGLKFHFGTWQIKGNPRTILIDFSDYWKNKDNIKKELWEKHNVDSLGTGGDFEEGIVWAWAAGRFIECFIETNKDTYKDTRFIGHFHEWLAGTGLLYLKESEQNIATVFTTHATMLGRTIAGSGRDLYDQLETLDPDQEARNSGIQAKHLTEKASANKADIFTTVSEITGMEATKLLGRKPEVLVLNGLDMSNMPTYEEVAYEHRINRRKIHEFLRYYFLPYYYFDTEKTVLLFIVGRYEFKNKGIDIVIDSLARLNEQMKEEKSEKSVVCFFWIPRDIHGVKEEISINKSAYGTLISSIEENMHSIRTRLAVNIIKTGNKNVTETSFEKGLLDKNFMHKIKQLEINFAKRGNPPFSTHNIPNENNDLIIRSFREKGLNNTKDDCVKVIFYPIYLSGIDGLTDLGYYDAMNACHLGLFPSYYEPWGYTPLECAALAVPSLTSDLGGFGRFLIQKDKGKEGIFVLPRLNKPYDDSVNIFTETLHRFVNLSPKDRVKQKIIAKDVAELADWKILVKNYFDAHEQAIQKAYGS